MMTFHKATTPEEEYQKIAADMRLWPLDRWIRQLNDAEPTPELIEQKIRAAIDDLRKDTVYINARYQVAVRECDTITDSGWPAMWHVSIKRRDKDVIRDWRVLQEIKNQIIGPENEGFELFPAESRLVDTANQYHLFVFQDPEIRLPLGFPVRLVSEQVGLKSRQRPFNNTKP